VLVEHCFKCHSGEAKKPKGGLLLDSRAGMLKGGDSGPAIVPGKPGESLLLKAVHYTDAGLRMPPKGQLPNAAIADLEKWVAIGAPAPKTRAAEPGQAVKALDIEAGRKFWAFQPPRHHDIPSVTNGGWCRGAIDRFILAKLEANGLQPAADADRAMLLRRVYFDLIGLPPTPEQIEAFCNDRSPDAFVRVVDGLLASPHFGERWGRHWLDVARYADSSGGGRSLLFKDAWRYRDYVIESLNCDKPYERFVAEQIAGDLLTASTPEERGQQLAATGLLALGPTNYERQDKDALEMDVVDEQLDTMGRAFLGMTIGCARCHDHKFDPIPTRDYYALAGIMRSTQSLIHDNVSRWVEQSLPMTAEQQAAVKRHDGAIAALKEKINLARAAEKKTGRVVASAAKGALAVHDLPGIVVDDAQAKRVGAWKRSTFTGTYIGEGYLYDDRKANGDKTLTFVPEIPKGGRYEVRLAYLAHPNRADKVPVTILAADGEHMVYVNEREAPPIEGRFISFGKFRFERGTQWFVMLSTEGTNGHVVADAVQFLPEDLPLEEKPASSAAGIKKPGLTLDSKQLEAELKRLSENGPPRPTAMSIKEAARIEDCRVCIRGNIHNLGAQVPRGFLQVATRGDAPVIPNAESGRRQLAAWLSSRDNPLTARVMVNRVWHHLFGTGLVRTVDNFGTVGEPASHPELLDFLAIQFVLDEWSVKRLVRSIVLSRAYRMSSDHRFAGQIAGRDPQLIDPENRLLWRMNRRRLDAEAIRDAMLVVSGRLDRTMGGPTVKKGTNNEYAYLFDDSRRSVYTPIFRNRLLELFEAFDFADPNLVMGRRNVSTVPTQALYLMNNPFVMEQSRYAAEVMLAVPNMNDAKRVERAYWTVLGRAPTEAECQLALRFVTPSNDAASWEGRSVAWQRFLQSLFACIDFRYVK
jgi:hypothetical protein